jgi:hypothetical protein
MGARWTMKFVAEYLQSAIQFERMAGESDDPTLKEHLLNQAADYRRLAKKRAALLGLPEPPPPPAKE